ncbi:MAG: DnaA regulatory inactivator Hda, partial [Gammaproteobacteria bacterium]
MTFTTNQQLILNGLRLRDDATFANYLPAQNQLVWAFLQAFTYTPQQWFVYLWGKPDSGRTHLLNALCLTTDQQGKSAIYLPMADMMTMSPVIFDDLESHDLICIDDIDLLVGQQAWEAALFHL